MNSLTRAPVVVGVDGSPESRAAVYFAAWEADRRRLPLRLVHAYRPTAGYEPAAVVGYEAERVATAYPGVALTPAVLAGDPARTLVDESARATLVVVGSRGLSSFHSLLLGSVSGAVAAHARVPVVVVRPTAVEATGVVVGVGGSPGSAAAVEFAFTEAAWRGTDLAAVYVWSAGSPADADRALVEAVAGWAEKYPEVEVVRRAVYGTNPVRTLIEESAGAELVVVGGYGRVGDGLVHHARVPVAVVPEPVVPDAGHS